MLYGAAPSDDDEPSGQQSDEDIVKEANERWHAIKDWQGDSDERARSDIKFANGDSRNAWQWPDKIYQERTGGQVELPALTINKTRVHNDIIINGMSKSGMGIKVRPTGGKASYQSARIMQCIIRRIEYISWSTQQYRKVAEPQVDGGIGYITIDTRYVSNKSNDQDIYFKAARDPTGVYLDRWCEESVGSDSGHGFVFDEMPRKEFNRQYPKWKNKVGSAPLNTEMASWLSDKSITVVKYFRKSPKSDTYVWYKESENAEPQNKLASEIREESGPEIYKKLIEDIKEGRIEGGTRQVTDHKVEWFMIAGDTIIDRGEWAGKYIPIGRAVGREVVIDKTLDRKGHTRPLIDAQRMLNYAASCSVEHVASSVKSQWLAPLRAIEGGVESAWKDSNVKTLAVLPYNDTDDTASQDNQQIAPPQRIEPPKPAAGWLQVGQDAERHLMMVSGQYQAQMGEDDRQSAASGKAINERQEQGDTATYHFLEHMADLKRFLGVQLLDLIPKIYDTKRALHVLDEKGEKFWIQIDPDQEEAVREMKDLKKDEEAVSLAFNPTIGEYECVSDPGPDYATQRQEAWNAVTQIIVANKELVAVIGDLLFKYGDFPGADDIMERLQKEIKATKPYLFDDNQDPQLAALMEQNKNLLSINSDLITKLAEEKLKIRGRDERRDIEAFKAQTERMRADADSLKMTVEALSKIMLTPQQRAQLDHEIAESGRQRVHEIEKLHTENIYGLIEQANEPDVSNANGSAE
jgi:Phage P22-like portal protein